MPSQSTRSLRGRTGARRRGAARRRPAETSRRRGALPAIGRGLSAAAAILFALGVYACLTLPDVRPLRAGRPRVTAFQALRAHEARARGERPRQLQEWVPYGRISPHLTRAVIVAEDARFWQHDGVDYAQLKASIETNLERLEFARGASTITQQLAKNLYLSPRKDPLRKLRELLIARRLEAELSKRRILELYLNVIEWGDGVYGAEAAARTYFRKPASQIDLDEAALLAAAIVNPRVLDPARPSARLRRRQAMIAGRMGAVTAMETAADDGGGARGITPLLRRAADDVPPLPAASPPQQLPGPAAPAPGPR